MFGNKIRLVKTPTQFRRAKCVAPNCICEFELKAVLDVLEGHGYFVGIRRGELFIKDSCDTGEWESSDFSSLVKKAYSLSEMLLEDTDKNDFEYYLEVKTQNRNVESVYRYLFGSASEVVRWTLCNYGMLVNVLSPMKKHTMVECLLRQSYSKYTVLMLIRVNTQSLMFGFTIC